MRQRALLTTLGVVTLRVDQSFKDENFPEGLFFSKAKLYTCTILSFPLLFLTSSH